MNKMKPIWLRNPDVVNQSEYTEFYKTTFKAWEVVFLDLVMSRMP